MDQQAVSQVSKEEAVQTVLLTDADTPFRSVEERIEAVERRHLFWRNRCLGHARTIDRQQKEIYALRAELRELTDGVCRHCDRKPCQC